MTKFDKPANTQVRTVQHQKLMRLLNLMSIGPDIRFKRVINFDADCTWLAMGRMCRVVVCIAVPGVDNDVLVGVAAGDVPAVTSGPRRHAPPARPLLLMPGPPVAALPRRPRLRPRPRNLPHANPRPAP